MQMTEVFANKFWDYRKHAYVIAPHKRTAEGIIASSGEIIHGSEEEVPDELIDKQGCFWAALDEGRE